MKKSILVLAALAAIISCSKENNHTDNYTAETFTVELTASAPSVNNGNGAAPASAMTKTTLVDGEGKKFVYWSKGDAIKVLLFPNRSNGNTITGPSGIFTSHFEEEASAEAYFRTDSWSWAGTPHDMMNDQRKNRLAKTGVAVYPSTATAVSNKPTSSTGSELNSEISFVLPEAQNAVVGNIESGLNFSYAEVDRDSFINTVDNGSKTELQFKNACALIQLTMPAEMQNKVTSISITSNDKVALTGKGSLNLNYYKDVVEGGVTVTEGNGVVLNSSTGFEAGKTYYAVVWPGEHKSGLTIEFTAEDGSVATKPTGTVTLTASKVKPYTFSKGLEFAAPPVKEFNYFYADGSTGNEVNSNIVGVVIFRGNPKTQFNDSDLPDQFCNGLAISVSSRKCAWNSQTISSIPSIAQITQVSNIQSYSIGGYTVKKAYGDAADSYTVFSNGVAPNGTSGWYLPTPMELNYIKDNLGGINSLLSKVGETVNPDSKSTSYWLPVFYVSKYNTGLGIWYYQNGLSTFHYEKYYNYPDNSNYCYYVRPIFAF